MSIGKQEISIGRCISVLYRQSQAFFSKKLHPFKIGSGQYAVLIALQDNDGVTQERLSARIGIDKANITRAVTKLQNEGYIVRRPDSDDKRVWRIYLTNQGKKMLPILEDILNEWYSTLSKGLSEHEFENFAINLKKMADNLGYEWTNDENSIELKGEL